MCIAIIKNKNVQLPSDTILQMCFKNNHDGAGFVVNRNGYNYIQKGFFTFKGFYSAFKEMHIKKEESALIHFRVATHGKVNIQNCHPFPIEKDFKNMVMPQLKTKSSVLVHNGKLDIDIEREHYSDSMHLAKNICQFNFTDNKFRCFLEYIIKPTQINIRGNRLAIIDCNGNIEKYGVGWIEDNDLWYSNDSYKQNGTYKQKKKII